MTTFVKIPFAQSGDKTVPPETDAAGGVNWTQGYTSAYSKDPATDPAAKRIEREEFNGIINMLSQAINEIQVDGVANLIEAKDNGGTPFVYKKGALVSTGGVVYLSLVTNNNTVPPGVNWAALPERIQPLSAVLTSLSGLTSSSNKIAFFTDKDVLGLTDFTSLARDILKGTSASQVLTTLGIATAQLLTSDASSSGILSPGRGVVLKINNNGEWGVYDGAGAVIPLGVGNGGTGAKTASGARASLGLGSAATRNVGTSNGTDIPDRSAWTTGGNSQAGWRISPDGFMEQWGTQVASEGSVISLSLPFPNSFDTVLITSSPNDTTSAEISQAWAVNKTTFKVGLATVLGGNTQPANNLNINWRAWGQ